MILLCRQRYGCQLDPRNDVSHQVSIDPVDDARIDISHLERGGHLWVSGATVHTNHVGHPPGPIRARDDHRHSRLHVQKDWVRPGRCNTALMINRHPFQASTNALAEEL